MLLYLARREALKRGGLFMNTVMKSQKRLLAAGAPAKPKASKPGLFPNGTTHADANDLPVPEGCYKDWYKAKNTKYSIFMYSGLVAAITSIYLFVTKEEVDFNFRIPEFVGDDDIFDDDGEHHEHDDHHHDSHKKK